MINSQITEQRSNFHHNQALTGGAIKCATCSLSFT